jgi:CheY-like chemotaxis protein
LTAQIESGIGVIVITDAVASDPRSAAIIAALNSQPGWSDTPTILLGRIAQALESVEPLARGEDSKAIITVSDNGIGIPEDLMPRIFGLFVQSARSLDRSEGGLGIGLSVVQRLVEMHGGSVTASSAGSGEGSTFEIRLPRINADGLAAREIVRTESASKRILVVDDDVDAATSIADLLRLDGHEVWVVHSATAALDRFRVFRPEIVLLDIGLPDMNGYQVAQRIRSADSAVRIVALTGYGQADDLQRARDSGFDAHLIKPVDFDRLGKLIGGREPERLGAR